MHGASKNDNMVSFDPWAAGYIDQGQFRKIRDCLCCEERKITYRMIMYGSFYHIN
jgi:hypothetical protein